MSSPLVRLLQQADKHLQAGNYPAAQAACEQALRKAPRHPDVLMLSGVVQLALGHPDRGVTMLEQALAVDPGHGAALEHLGLACLMLGRFAQAEQALSKASRLSGAPPSVYMRLGIAILEQGRAHEALPWLERAAAATPGDPDAQLNLGRAHANLGNAHAARAAFESAQRMAPQRPEPAYNLGVIALESGDLTHAQQRFEQALAAAPGFVDARLSLGIVFQRQAQYPRALEYMHQALAQEPHNAAACAALASTLFQTGQLDESKAAAERCLVLDPQNAASIGTLANILVARNELAPAIEKLEEGYARTRNSALLGMLVHLLRQACDWERWQSAWADMQPLLATEAELGSPFWLMCEPVGSKALLDYTRRWAQARFGPAAVRPAMPEVAGTPRRLRIGYLSSDLHEHATAYLIADVIERHDRERFEIFAYSYGPGDESVMRTRLRSAFEHFVDIAHLSDDAAAARIREDCLDLLVDLKGYTLGDRLTIMAQRPCARQATWLGYPGTSAAPFMDYLIADSIVIPEGDEVHYTERIVRLPHCYQPNDRARAVADPLDRAEYGLPTQGQVLCCFNQTYKITPDVFAVWMRVLEQAGGSVLWLFDSNALAVDNLRHAAATHGVDPRRLVFATRLPNAQHLARYRVADLALDTSPYTSHTTMSDALWCGCPAVALRGETFAARVSSSVLLAAGLPELVARSLDEYEQTILRLAQDPARVQALRQRIERDGHGSPLFDSASFARDLEARYVEMIGGCSI